MTNLPHLADQQVEELRTELLRMRKKLEGSMRTTSQAMKPIELDQGAVSRLSRIQAAVHQL